MVRAKSEKKAKAKAARKSRKKPASKPTPPPVQKEMKPGPGKFGNLTNKQSIFVAEYLKDMNGQRAATVAGFRSPSAQCSTLLDPTKYPMVAAAIREGLAKKRDTANVEASQILQELVRIGFFNPKDMLDGQGRMKSMHELPDYVAACIKEVRIRHQMGFDEDGDRVRFVCTEIKFHDKLNALEMLSKLLGLLPKNEKSDNQHVTIVAWDTLHAPRKQDLIEARIRAEEDEAAAVVEGRSVPQLTVDKLRHFQPDNSNGNGNGAHGGSNGSYEDEPTQE